MNRAVLGGVVGHRGLRFRRGDATPVGLSGMGNSIPGLLKVSLHSQTRQTWEKQKSTEGPGEKA